ncbi:MAG: AMP-binding protein [Fischerella sp. CENA71]|nr:AMP-binding protein [Fischerella sp. CENA71]
MSKQLSLAEVINSGVEASIATAILPQVNQWLASLPAADCWQHLTQHILKPSHPFALHELLYQTTFSDWDKSQGFPPAWFPSTEQIQETNIARLMKELKLNSYFELHTWSTQHRAEFWDRIIQRLGIQFHKKYTQVVDLSDGVESPKWLLGAKFNIVESCFQAPVDAPAIIFQAEGGSISTLTYGELHALTNRVANGLVDAGFQKGDRIAIAMPMTAESVAIYLGIIKAGCIVVSIADSFVAAEIAMRLHLSKAKAIFTQDYILRGGKQLPLYTKIVDANAPRAIVIETDRGRGHGDAETRGQGDMGTGGYGEIGGEDAGTRGHGEIGGEDTGTRGYGEIGGEDAGTRGHGDAESIVDRFSASPFLPLTASSHLSLFASPRLPLTASSNLRPGDLTWKEFLSANEQFDAVPADPAAYTNILFSSGTTGEPKAIPWTQTTPIKCAADGYLHHDIHPHDVVTWYTNLGWMMGPWLIFATLINRAAIALYYGIPTVTEYGQFIRNAHVNILGVVPSLVSSWKATSCMQGLDWSAIKAFSSTGECSNPQDMLYLMSLAGYKPVIEYCGGTEIGGGYMTGTLVQPCAPSTFSTPALGLDVVILNADGYFADKGEVFIIPPSIGLSTELLNKDHHQVYFANTPYFSISLRRHSDQMERLPNHCYRAHGRVDDTMNLGGIKVSSTEIEQALNAEEGVCENAAVAISPPEGGPSQLIIYAVVKPEVQKNKAKLIASLQAAINQRLNPLFKIHDIVIVDTLPRTASNKIVRRVLREQYSPCL